MPKFNLTVPGQEDSASQISIEDVINPRSQINLVSPTLPTQQIAEILGVNLPVEPQAVVPEATPPRFPDVPQVDPTITQGSSIQRLQQLFEQQTPEQQAYLQSVQQQQDTPTGISERLKTLNSEQVSRELSRVNEDSLSDIIIRAGSKFKAEVPKRVSVTGFLSQAPALLAGEFESSPPGKGKVSIALAKKQGLEDDGTGVPTLTDAFANRAALSHLITLGRSDIERDAETQERGRVTAVEFGQKANRVERDLARRISVETGVPNQHLTADEEATLDQFHQETVKSWLPVVEEKNANGQNEYVFPEVVMNMARAVYKAAGEAIVSPDPKLPLVGRSEIGDNRALMSKNALERRSVEGPEAAAAFTLQQMPFISKPRASAFLTTVTQNYENSQGQPFSGEYILGLDTRSVSKKSPRSKDELGQEVVDFQEGRARAEVNANKAVRGAQGISQYRGQIIRFPASVEPGSKRLNLLVDDSWNPVTNPWLRYVYMSPKTQMVTPGTNTKAERGFKIAIARTFHKEYQEGNKIKEGDFTPEYLIQMFNENSDQWLSDYVGDLDQAVSDIRAMDSAYSNGTPPSLPQFFVEREASHYNDKHEGMAKALTAMNLAMYKDAQRRNSSFTHDQFVEPDGNNNGVALQAWTTGTEHLASASGLLGGDEKITFLGGAKVRGMQADSFIETLDRWNLNIHPDEETNFQLREQLSQIFRDDVLQKGFQQGVGYGQNVDYTHSIYDKYFLDNEDTRYEIFGNLTESQVDKLNQTLALIASDAMVNAYGNKVFDNFNTPARLFSLAGMILEVPPVVYYPNGSKVPLYDIEKADRTRAIRAGTVTRIDPETQKSTPVSAYRYPRYPSASTPGEKATEGRPYPGLSSFKRASPILNQHSDAFIMEQTIRDYEKGKLGSFIPIKDAGVTTSEEYVDLVESLNNGVRKLPQMDPIAALSSSLTEMVQDFKSRLAGVKEVDITGFGILELFEVNNYRNQKASPPLEYFLTRVAPSRFSKEMKKSWADNIANSIREETKGARDRIYTRKGKTYISKEDYLHITRTLIDKFDIRRRISNAAENNKRSRQELGLDYKEYIQVTQYQ